MTLAHVLSDVGEDFLVCDLAQYYGVLDWKSHPMDLIATLTVGLPDESRIKRKLSGIDLPIAELLQAQMVDALNLILWTKTKDAQKGKNKPESIVNRLLNNKETNDDYVSFKTPEELEAYFKQFEV